MTDRKTKLLGVFMANLATLTWATNIILARWLKDDIGPLTLAAFRFHISSVLFLCLLRRQPSRERRPGNDLWLLLGMSLCGVVVFTPLLYYGIQNTTAVNATLIQGVGPLITAFLAALLIGEGLTLGQIGGGLLGVLGVAGLISGGSFSFLKGIETNRGDIIVFGAVILWSLYSILSRKASRTRSSISTTALPIFFSLPVLLLLCIWEMQTVAFHMRPEVLLAVIYIGIFPSLAGVWAFNKAVSILGASGTMHFYNTLVLYGVLLAVVLLGERLEWNHVLYGSIIVAGGLWGSMSVR